MKYTGSISDGLSQGQLHPITKFGREFSIVNVPYSFKLFMQELLAMNIRMSLITEDNISQIENMGFSVSIDPNLIINETNDLLKVSNTPEHPPLQNRILPKYEIRTPVYTPDDDVPPNEPDNDLIPTTSQHSIPSHSLPSPEFTPPTPPTPPNYLPNKKPEEPEELEQPELKTGGKVHYRGDIKASRLWNIDHVWD